MKCLLLFCVGILLAPLSVVLGDDAKKDESTINGTWKATSAELSGKKFPKEAAEGITLTLKNGEYDVEAESPDHGTVKYDDSAKPKEMDIKGTEGPNKGKTFLAIYELSGDKLKICYDLSGETRPTEFKTQPNTKLFLVTYERKKP